MNKKTEVIGIVIIILALIVLIFGDNLYQQINGLSFFENTPTATNHQVETPSPTLQQSIQIQPSLTPPTTIAITSVVQNLEGTVWAGTDSDGDYYVYEFLPGGVLKFTSPTGTFAEDKWEQNGNSVYMEMSNKYCEYTGVINGDTITGNAWNKDGHTWTWTAKKQ
ncbi:MAG: hypothetical protein J0L96_09705 [Anaerolineae bacterium]|jgi:hypothetical protein|nr:hypothetical protein [Anaerolineae bacterium]